jgi:hypothetical protein
MIQQLLRSMRPAGGPVTALALAALALALAGPAQASGPDDFASDGFGIEGLVVDSGFTQASFQNLHYEFEECGSPHEVTCTWEVRATLETAPDKDCDPDAPGAQVWSSGEQAGNGSIDSGPLSFGLLGCKGQVLVISYEFHKTYDWGGDPAPPLIITGGGGTLTFVHLGYYPLAEAEQMVLNANPHPGFVAMPTPPSSVPRVSPDCRSLFSGERRYGLKFKRIGCWKVARLVARSWPGASPAGFRCAFKHGGAAARCVSTSDPRKFYAWHPPRKPAVR